MKTALGILLGVMLAGVGVAQAGKDATANSRPKPSAKQRTCAESRSAFIGRFSRLVSTFRDQVELAEATPRIALSQRVADLQKTALELKSVAIPACVLASGHSDVATSRQAIALMIEFAALFWSPGDTTGSSAETMKKAIQELQKHDDEIEATCRGLSKEKALNFRLQVWKSDANIAANFEIKRFLTFMKHASDETAESVEGALYSVAAREFWRTKADGKR